MDVKEAVIVETYFADLFAADRCLDQGLEEVNFDEPSGTWEITIGFRRSLPADSTSNALAQLLSKYALERSYKVVRISDATRKVMKPSSNKPKIP